jgi:hypothetical protein
MWQPINDLERAFQDAHLSLEDTVEYFRELRESILLFLIPYEPGREGLLQVGDGNHITFVLWKIQGEDMIPVFTSTARAEEALHAAGKMNEKNGVAEMLGLELMHILSMQPNCKAIINPGCASGSRIMDLKMITSVWDGSALFIPSPGERALNGLVMSLPARQPARLREPLCKFLSGCPEVKAAWLFYEEEPAKPFEFVYAVGIMVEGGDAKEILRETSLAIEGACPPEWKSRAWIMDPKDKGLTEIMATLPPFYSAPDFKAPEKPAPEKK